MEPVRLTLGCGNYDRTRALVEGTVKPEGIDLAYVQDTPHHLFERVLIDDEFDATEMSVSNFTTLVARGDRRFIGIPVFFTSIDPYYDYALPVADALIARRRCDSHWRFAFRNAACGNQSFLQSGPTNTQEASLIYRF